MTFDSTTTEPHPCEHEGCDHVVIYDDEPFCFTHSPDSGSSVTGYSWRARTHRRWLTGPTPDPHVELLAEDSTDGARCYCSRAPAPHKHLGA